MCILFLYANPQVSAGKFRLILAANRDEYFKRPSKQAHFWSNYPSVLGGMDMELGKEGGSWLAMSKTGRIGALLNVMGKYDKNLTGRGSIVSEYVIGTQSSEMYFNKLKSSRSSVSGYNFVAVEMRESNTDIFMYSNVSPEDSMIQENNGIFGVGNGFLQHPHEKVKAGEKIFSDIISRHKEYYNVETLTRELLVFLQSKERYFPDPTMMEQAPNYPLDKLEKLSSVFVNISDLQYGTRAHTIVIVDGNGSVYFEEHSLQPTTHCWMKEHYSFHLSFK